MKKHTYIHTGKNFYLSFSLSALLFAIVLHFKWTFSPFFISLYDSRRFEYFILILLLFKIKNRPHEIESVLALYKYLIWAFHCIELQRDK